MKYLSLFFSLLVAGFFLSQRASAQEIIINELFNSGGNDEWVELLVVQDSLDLRGWSLRDYSSGGVAQQPLNFTNHALWSSLRKGTLIIVARPENTSLSEDLDPSDYLLVVKSSNSLYFTGTVFLFAGSSDAIQIRNAVTTHVFGVSWGASNASSLPAPKAHFTTASSSGTSVAYAGGSLVDLTNLAQWNFNSASVTFGVGNTPANASWISTLRSRPDGSGTARVSPDTLFYPSSGSVTITYRRDTQFAVNALRIIVPSAFTWPRNVSAITVSGVSATPSVSGDTIAITNITFTSDSAIVTISSVTAPESTAFYPFKVQSRQNAFGDVTPVPRIAVFGTPVPIAEVKMNDAQGIQIRTGELVTISGIVTVANQFGGPSYVQDNSAGIAIFGSSFSTAVTIGDEVIVSGVVNPFNGLSELTSPILRSIVSSGNSVSPVLVTCSQLFNDGAGGVEEFEGKLVRLNVVTVGDTSRNPIPTWAVSGAGTNYRLFDVSGYVDIRVDADVNFANTPAPQGSFDVIGVVSQFKPTLPFIGGYQLMPRFSSDIHATGPIIVTLPEETNITSSSLTVNWTTLNQGTSRLRYGRTQSYELGTLAPDSALRTSHSITIPGLLPATVYHIEAFSVSGPDTSHAPNLIASTASPPQSSGAINVYFTKSVNTNLAWYQPANGNQDLVQRIVARITNARRSIDVCLYSLSGTPGSTIASALVAAKNRGVRVRVIAEYDNSNTTAFQFIFGNGIPLITDRFDPVNNGVGLQHNKFFVIDARGGAPESVWVWTGSWNPTEPGTNADYQNAVELQDLAFGQAYTMEFDEMWGSSGETPVAANSRFGARKTNNTPHKFVVGGVPVELYFSPSDGTTGKIARELNSAQRSIGFQLLTFTRSDLATILVNKKNDGKKVRGNLDNNTDSGNQYAFLRANNIDVNLKTGSGLLHHKYAIVDAEDPALNPKVVTGSHNWSNSAENQNNENTIIIRSGNVANQFLQEFAARYYQFGGNDSILVSIEETGGAPSAFALEQNYPNPFNPVTVIRFAVPSGIHAPVELRLYDMLGREVATLVNDRLQGGNYRVELNGAHLASGVYLYRLKAGSLVAVRKMMLVK